ncbi:hypothetical protein QWY64_14495 [Enterobacter hormaechei]|uniref:hypothetical protein n=1 Tax=Enterobacter hormaechei TaxID=158836 RepID=UPI0025B52C46|nr:hypothetical protein [Enterobacter hormaechei]MDN3797355.1 hypothetical protein [Enterobacter hormaechei]
MNIKYAAVIIETEDGWVVQRHLTMEESAFVLFTLHDEGTLKVFPCEGVEFCRGAISKVKNDSPEAS